jgi:hypothetical protein
MKGGKETTETEWKRNVDLREKFIKSRGGNNRKLGEQKFFEMGETEERYKKLRDIPIPKEYNWIFKHFMQIWQGCDYDMMGNIIFTFHTINEYVECMEVPLTVEDKKMLLKMKAWACNTISEMKDKNE